MSFLQSLAAAFKGGAHSRVPLARTLTSPWYFAEAQARAPFEYATAVRRAYLDNPVAQRAVRLVAEGIGGAPLAPADPALARLVTATSGGQALLETLTAQLLLHGNAYVQVIKDALGQPVELFALSPERVSIVADAAGWPSAYAYKVGERTLTIPALDDAAAPNLIHIRHFHPADDHYGAGCLVAADQAVATHNAAANWNRALLENAARPSGALVYDPGDAGGLTGEQFERLKTELAGAYAPAAQDYLAGFALSPGDGAAWQAIDQGCDEAQARAHHETFVWALPQISRDGFVRLPVPAPAPTPESAMQAFDDLSYPLALGRDATVMPEFSTTIAVTASGHERRNSLWADARLRFDVGPGLRSEGELGVLLGFFRARRGAARGFRLRDPADFSSNGMSGTPALTDQDLGTGDGQRTRFALIKRYGLGPDAQVRRITRPVAASLLVSLNGVAASGWTLDPLGELVFAVAPAAGVTVSAGFLFDVPVRFAEDRLELSGVTFAAGDAPSVPLVELREAP